MIILTNETADHFNATENYSRIEKEKKKKNFQKFKQNNNHSTKKRMQKQNTWRPMWFMNTALLKKF